MKIHLAILCGRISTAAAAISLNFLLVEPTYAIFANKCALYFLWPALIGIFDLGFANWINLSHEHQRRQLLLRRLAASRFVIAGFSSALIISLVVRFDIIQTALLFGNLTLASFLTTLSWDLLKLKNGSEYVRILFSLFLPASAYLITVNISGTRASLTVLLFIEICVRILFIISSPSYLRHMIETLLHINRTPRKSFLSIGFTYSQLANFLLLGADSYFLSHLSLSLSSANLNIASLRNGQMASMPAGIHATAMINAGSHRFFSSISVIVAMISSLSVFLCLQIYFALPIMPPLLVFTISNAASQVMSASLLLGSKRLYVQYSLLLFPFLALLKWFSLVNINFFWYWHGIYALSFMLFIVLHKTTLAKGRIA